MGYEMWEIWMAARRFLIGWAAALVFCLWQAVSAITLLLRKHL